MNSTPLGTLATNVRDELVANPWMNHDVVSLGIDCGQDHNPLRSSGSWRI